MPTFARITSQSLLLLVLRAAVFTARVFAAFTNFFNRSVNPAIKCISGLLQSANLAFQFSKGLRPRRLTFSILAIPYSGAVGQFRFILFGHWFPILYAPS